MQSKSNAAKGPGERVALLRGINVGGKNKLPMQALRALFEEAGARSVRTYIQSGNVLYAAAPSVAARLPGRVTRAIESQFGFRIPVVTRTAEELRRTLLANPFTSSDPAMLSVAFLDKTPASGCTLDPDRSPPDEVRLIGDTVYMRFPNGIARTRFTNAYLDKALGVTSTARNWNTLNKLVELSQP